MFRIQTANLVPLNGHFSEMTLEKVLRTYQHYSDWTSGNPALKEANSRTTPGRPLYLENPPILTKDGDRTVLSPEKPLTILMEVEEGFKEVPNPENVVTHPGVETSEGLKTQTFSTSSGYLWTQEFVLRKDGEDPHYFSQAFMFDRDSNGKVLGWAWLFGRSNGLSNLADELLEGFFTSPEHLFQGFKVLFVFSLRMKAVEESQMSEAEKEAAMNVLWEQLLAKLAEVHAAANGFKAKQAVNFKVFEMSKPEIEEWGRHSTTVLLFCMMFRLVDPVSFGVIQKVAVLEKQLPGVPFLVGEIAGKGEEQYSTAMTGTQFKDAMVEGEFKKLIDANGFNQKRERGIDKAWEKDLSPHNIAGNLAMFLVLTAKKTLGVTHEVWGKIFNPVLLFPVIGTPWSVIKEARAARDRAIDEVLAAAKAFDEAEADTASPGTKRPCPDA